MQFKRVYIPKNAISQHEDFDAWYEDGDLFLHAQGDWKSEKSKVEIFSRAGGSMAEIKPDYKALLYDLRVERYTYTLHTYTIFEHYFIEGMLWQVHGSLATSKRLHFVHEGTKNKDVTISTVNFKDKGLCYEVKVRDVSVLRIAAVAVIAMALKEEYRGLSEGERDDKAPWYKKLSRYFFEKGIPYEEILKNSDATK